MEEIIEFSKLIGKLKKIERTGWVTKANIENPESVAEHVFRSATISMVIGDLKRLDTEKMIRMSLLHELQEAIMGDWDVYTKKKLGQERFEKRERETIKEVLGKLPKELEIRYMDIWKEFQEKKTKEAKLVEQIEKLEMVFQALEYEKEGYDKDKLETFWKYVKERLEDSELKKIFEALEKERLD